MGQAVRGTTRQFSEMGGRCAMVSAKLILEEGGGSV